MDLLSAPTAGLTELASFDRVAFAVRRDERALWIVAAVDGREVLALRAGFSATELGPVNQTSGPDGTVVFEFAGSLGAMRAKIAFPAAGQPTVRCTVSVLPAHDVAVTEWPRDLLAAGEHGTVHTAQRGLRTGIVFASGNAPAPHAFFYLQDFSALNAYFEQTGSTPADTVGGRWPELGFALPAGPDRVLPKARETVVSDAYLTVTPRVPDGDGEVAAQYLDMLADTYLCLPRPDVVYHDWPQRAARTLRDLSLSPGCSYEHGGRRFLMPYVGDGNKPPESMVQLTLTVNTYEYDRWRNASSALAQSLRANAPLFFDEEVGSVVRWLPGADFGASQGEENMNHEAMDSWYLHHPLFNLCRLAREGDDEAKELVRRSLPYVIRVARRFNYRWPIFFNLRTLDVIRAEAAPGRGGETDVGGIYALVMLHAHEMFGDQEYLDEAERGAQSLQGLGFDLGYQLNTTGFAAEAAMRLWKKTRNRAYLAISEICMANIFDNMWLWRCEYGRAHDYRLFFGLFPLRDAPYIAPYEELEAQGKFHDYLPLGGEDVRPSLRLLLAEWQKYALDRGWFYYPDALPRGVLAEKSRNGRIEPGVSVPLEDLQDGRSASGSVGQEIYGAGMPFVFTSRHYARVEDAASMLYCNYPMYDFNATRRGKQVVARWRAGGDPRCGCELRVIPREADAPLTAVSATTTAGEVEVPLEGRVTPEGHAAFSLRGGQTAEVRWHDPRNAPPHSVAIGFRG